MERFDVYVLRFDVNEERATRGLMQVFGLSEAAARIFVHSVPRVGKRELATDTAERYVRALHALGAVVECRRSGASPLGDTSNRIQPMSLPPPTTSQYPGASRPPTIMQDSLGIMGPLAYSPDMPTIPKAPRIPADLHAIRHRKGPDSLAPNWRGRGNENTPSRQPGWSSAGFSTPSTPNPDGNSMDAGMYGPDSSGLPGSSDPLAKLESPFRGRGRDDAAPPPPSDGARDPSRSPELDRAALEKLMASPTPLSPSPFAPSGRADDAPPWYATTTYQLALACVMIGGMIAALSAGLFETDAKRLARAFRDAGIETGAYEPAERYLTRAGSQFDALPPDQLRGMLDRLTKAGAKGVWVCNIEQHGGTRSSRTLLVELPKNTPARQAVIAQLARSRAPTNDSGQRFLQVAF
jgi:hypothetical protein